MSLDGVDEPELIAAWQLGDRRAGDALLRRHVSALRQYLQRSGGPVDDLVQETLMQCVRTIGRFRGDARFRTFLLAVASNVSRDHARRNARSHIAATNDLASESTDLDAKLDEARAWAELNGGIARLPEHARRVIRLQYWDELTSDEISTLLVIPAGSVRRWQMLARRQLARAIRARSF